MGQKAVEVDYYFRRRVIRKKMTEEKKKKVVAKTINLTGKAIKKSSLVVKEVLEKKVVGAEEIKKLNEKIKKEKEAGKLEKEVGKLGKAREVLGKNGVMDKEQAERGAEKVERGKRGELGAGQEKAADGKVVETEVKEVKYELTIGLRDLLAAGCHLGHKVSKTHPKARKNIYMSKDGIEIFDLVKTLEGLKAACNFLHNAKRSGKQIVMLGTKRQAREVVKRVAMEAGVGYVTDRWLGGTVTNWDQIRKNIKKLTDLKEKFQNNDFSDKTKKEIGEMRKKVAKLEKLVGGLEKTDKLFDVLVVVDAGYEKTAVKEAADRGVKTVALVDTDSNPEVVDFAVAANDDNAKSVTLLVEEFGKALRT